MTKAHFAETHVQLTGCCAVAVPRHRHPAWLPVMDTTPYGKAPLSGGYGQWPGGRMDG
jgi:hypothetical protein